MSNERVTWELPPAIRNAVVAEARRRDTTPSRVVREFFEQRWNEFKARSWNRSFDTPPTVPLPRYYLAVDPEAGESYIRKAPTARHHYRSAVVTVWEDGTRTVNFCTNPHGNFAKNQLKPWPGVKRSIMIPATLIDDFNAASTDDRARVAVVE